MTRLRLAAKTLGRWYWTAIKKAPVYAAGFFSGCAFIGFQAGMGMLP